MVQRTYPDDATTERSSAEEFMDLVCADEDLLRAEFEAIVAAEFPPAPARPRLPSRPAHHPERHRAPSVAGPGTGPGGAGCPGTGEWTRQRSPPGRALPGRVGPSAGPTRSAGSVVPPRRDLPGGTTRGRSPTEAATGSLRNRRCPGGPCR